MFLTIVFIIMMVGLLTGTGFRAKKELSINKTYGISGREFEKLSWPAKTLLKEYRSLPESSRPSFSILDVVTALDVKHGVEEASNHFQLSERDYSYNSKTKYNITYAWHHCHCGYYNNSRDCIGWDYRNIHEGIRDIKSAIEEQDHALRLSGVESGLASAKELTERLAEERDIIKNITKELEAR